MASSIVGQCAPDFSGKAVVNGQIKDISLADYKDQWLVLFFYPLDFTFVCPTEILAFSDRIADFKAIKTDVVGVSVDSHYTHLAWTNTPRNKGGIADLAYPLLSDLSRKIAADYGILLEDAGIALRGLFVIDPDGQIQHATINNLGIGRSVDETLRIVQAAQYVRDNGEVCPANWTPGSAAMKPDPVGSQEYFATVTG